MGGTCPFCLHLLCLGCVACWVSQMWSVPDLREGRPLCKGRNESEGAEQELIWPKKALPRRGCWQGFGGDDLYSKITGQQLASCLPPDPRPVPPCSSPVMQWPPGYPTVREQLHRACVPSSGRWLRGHSHPSNSPSGQTPLTSEGKGAQFMQILLQFPIVHLGRGSERGGHRRVDAWEVHPPALPWGPAPQGPGQDPAQP